MEPAILARGTAEKLALFDKLKAGKVGDVIEWREFEALTGRSVRQGPSYLSLWKARRKCLEELGLVWEPLSNRSGLKCLSPQETLTLGVAALKRIQRGAERAIVKLNTIDKSALSNQEKLRLIASQSMLSALASAAKEDNLRKIEDNCKASSKPMIPSKTLSIILPGENNE